MPQVSITRENADGTIAVLARFNTIREAEDFIANLEKSDPESVFAGRYGIDAPEETINPKL